MPPQSTRTSLAKPWEYPKADDSPSRQPPQPRGPNPRKTAPGHPLPVAFPYSATPRPRLRPHPKGHPRTRSPIHPVDNDQQTHPPPQAADRSDEPNHPGCSGELGVPGAVQNRPGSQQGVRGGNPNGTIVFRDFVVWMTQPVCACRRTSERVAWGSIASGSTRMFSTAGTRESTACSNAGGKSRVRSMVAPKAPKARA